MFNTPLGSQNAQWNTEIMYNSSTMWPYSYAGTWCLTQPSSYYNSVRQNGNFHPMNQVNNTSVLIGRGEEEILWMFVSNTRDN